MEEKPSLFKPVALTVSVLFGILLFLSWKSIPATRAIWDSFDEKVFYFLNNPLKEFSTDTGFWVVINNRLFDLVPAIVMVYIYTFYIFSGDKKDIRDRVVKGFVMSVYMMAVTKGVHYTIYTFERLSPTLHESIISPYRMTQVFSFSTKDSSGMSFPSDHSTVLMIICGFIWFYTRKAKYIIPAIITTIVFSIPRLVGGGHWITDVIVGGAVTTSIFLGICFCTPLHQKLYVLLNKPVNKACDIAGKFISVLHIPDEAAEPKREADAG